MSEPMSEEWLTEIEARVRAASPWPWTVEPVDRVEMRRNHRIKDANGLTVSGVATGTPYLPDAELIGHAPADIAALLSEVRRLRRENHLLHLSRGSAPDLLVGQH